MKYFLLLCTCIMLCNISQSQTFDPNSLNKMGNIPATFRYTNELRRMAFVPGGSFMSNNFVGTDSLTLTTPLRITVGSFYIGRFEVSNAEYRQFVNYVKDSSAHLLLGDIEPGTGRIDWAKKIDWKATKLEPLMLSTSDRINGKAEVDVAKLIYRSGSGETTAVYPDTLVWIQDFAYSYNEPFVKRYFSHPAFDNYPVVGVNQQQARAYCSWKTEMWNNALASVKYKGRVGIRLPQSYEWELAAQQSGRPQAGTNIFDAAQKGSYKNPNTQSYTNKGYKSNFGRIVDANGFVIKDYPDDGNFYTAACNAYSPDNKGIYNLAGNVAEWTGNYGSYTAIDDKANDEQFEQFKLHFPNSPLSKMTRKEVNAYLGNLVIVKGGSWSTIPFYLQPGVSQYFSPSESHCNIGFRIAMDIY